MDNPKVSTIIDAMFPDSFLTIFIDNLMLNGYDPDKDDCETLKTEFEILKNKMRKVLDTDESLVDMWKNNNNQIAIAREVSGVLTTHLRNRTINTRESFHGIIFMQAISRFLQAYPEYIRINSIVLVKE